MIKHSILFVSEKWCDADPAMGLTNTYHVLFGSLKRSGLDIPYNVIHYDELMINHKTHIDNVLEKVVEKHKPTIIIFSLLMGPKQHLNPSIPVIKNLQNKGYFTCFIWPDIQPSFGVNELKSYNNVASLHVSHAGERTIENNEVEIMWLWTSLDPKLYFPSTTKTIDVSFIGSVRYTDRQHYLKHIIDNGIPITIEGGQRERKLTPENYASLIRNSKITIGFPRSPGTSFQLKGRVFEALSSNTLLIEEKNPITPLYIKPGFDYVEFSNKEDLVDKIRYYMKNDNERIKIAENGYNTFQSKYTAKHFWKNIFDRITEKTNTSML